MLFRSLESFTYSVSHDLRASLRHISAFVEIVNEDWRSAGLGELDTSLNSGLPSDLHLGISNHLATITNAAQHMALMIDALMALSRLGRVELNLSRVDVRPLIDEVVQAMQLPAKIIDPAGPTAPQAALIHWRIADDFPPLHADPVLVRQLLQHLISNAIKFTRPSAGRPPAQVEIGWRWAPAAVPNAVADTVPDAVLNEEANDVAIDIPRQPPLCELFIKDNGAGFNPKFGSKLFGVFQRLHSASAFEGIGMGLALCRRIVERHGGSIAASSPVFWSDSQDTGGCEVRFTLGLTSTLQFS